MSHVSHGESYNNNSHCLGLLSKYQEKKEEEELASTRPVGFAAGKNILSLKLSPDRRYFQ